VYRVSHSMVEESLLEKDSAVLCQIMLGIGLIIEKSHFNISLRLGTFSLEREE